MKPIIWYHGGPRVTNWEHLRWDRDRHLSSPNDQGAGMYWTTDPEEASSYTYKVSDPVVYSATMRDGFRLLPKQKPTLLALYALYELAEPDDQETFLSNYRVEDYQSPSREEIRSVLQKFSHQTSLFDAYTSLYVELFRYNADAYVKAMQVLGYDGFIVEKGTTGGSRRRKHLVVWNPRKLEIEEEIG